MTEAEAERFRVEALAEAEANKTRLAGQAEAEAALAKGKAEAEAKQKDRQCLQGIWRSSCLEYGYRYATAIDARSSTAARKYRKISVVDTGSSSGETSGANRVTNYATNLLSSTQETLKATTGLDLKEIVENLSTRGTTSQVNMYEAPKEAEQNSMKEE